MSAPPEIDPEDPRIAYLLGVADDELVIGHRHSHWTGVAPSLEEDLAFATVSQDEISHADVWYQALVGPERPRIDALGLGRPPEGYRHAVLCELLPGDFAFTLARQFLYDHFDTVRLRPLTESSDPDVAAAARRLLHEERYHILHADEWLRRISNGGPDASRRLGDALRAAWPDALWLFEPSPGEDKLVADGIVPVASPELVGPWLEEIAPRLEQAGHDGVITGVEDHAGGARLPEGHFSQPGGRHGVHTPAWTEDAWEEMTRLYRDHPDARW